MASFITTRLPGLVYEEQDYLTEAAVAQGGRVARPLITGFHPSLLLSTCQSVHEQDTEPQVAPGG